MVERKTVSEFLPSRPQTTHSEKDLKTQHRKTRNEDIEAVRSARAEMVCFSLTVKEESLGMSPGGHVLLGR